MKFLLKPFLLVYSLYAYTLFVSFMLTGFIYTGLLSLLLGRRAHIPAFRYYKLWASSWFTLTGIGMKTEGKENLKKGQAYIITSNHTSNLDLLIAAYMLPLKSKALAKVEIKKIPVLGYLFGIISVFVDRKSKESRARSTDILKQWTGNGYSIFMYPEGTRNRTDEPLKEFYDGAFRMAIETQKPVLPVCVINGKAVCGPKTYLITPGRMKAIYLPPVFTEGMTEEDVPALREKVYGMMETCIRQNDKKFIKQ